MKKRSLILLLVLLVVLTLGALLLVIAIAGIGGGRVPDKVLLEADFQAQVFEHIPQDPFAQILLKDKTQLLDIVEALEKAADDDRVVGFIARVGQGNLGLAQIQEIRDAVIRFRESGKPAYAYTETFGEVSSGNGSYYLATAFDQIYLQPAGDVNLTGLFLESQFLRGTFDKIGVEPRIDHRYEYKNAKNAYTETEFTAAHREAMQSILDSIFGTMVSDMAEARNLEEDTLRDLIDHGPYLGAEAVEAGLVDGLAYRDQAYAAIRQATGDSSKLLYLQAYLKKAGRPHVKGQTIALIYGVGNVTRGKTEFDPLSGGSNMGSDTVAAAFRSAIEDDRVKAILFRVDSPGGSYVASDTIWRETVRARDAGKPVIVSMGNLAGSGGYFVAMHADKIVAQPGTITASIGVLGGKFLTSGMWEKLGISWDSVSSSANASMWTGTHDYNEIGEKRWQAWLDRVYEDFTNRVAEGRNLPLQKVLEIAKGRIWSGTDGKANGLVDELGGYPTALRLAREAIGLGPGAEVRLVVFPKPRSPFEELLGRPRESSEARTAVLAVARVFETLRPAVELARRVGLTDAEPQTLAMQREWPLEP